MQVVQERCAGLEVHKKNVHGCILVLENSGKKKQEVGSFGTLTAELLELAEWLREYGVTHVAMEATGVFWRLVWAVFAGQFEWMRVNPHHLKVIPGARLTQKIANGSRISSNTD